MESYDICIIGSGIAGTFAALRIAEKHKDIRTVVFDIGRPPAKRRRPLEGFLGCFPTGNGKICPNNLDSINTIMDGRKIVRSNQWVMEKLQEINPMKLIKDRSPSKHMEKILSEHNFSVKMNDYYQWRPEHVHKLSKSITASLENSKNVFFSFDNQVLSIKKDQDSFAINTEECSIECKKVILCAGRSGWRWVTELYRELDIIKDNNCAKYGVRIEIPVQHAKELNRSCCILNRDDLELGPFDWNGSITPEDHADVVVSSFRSNEERWKSEKLSFSVLKSVSYPNSGVENSDRIGKLTFLLFNDRVNKERLKSFIKGNSLISLLPEYSWLPDVAKELDNLFPKITDYAYMYLPHIFPMAASVELDQNLQSKIPGLYIAGESANIKGILGAAVSGCIAANEACKSAEITVENKTSKPIEIIEEKEIEDLEPIMVKDILNNMCSKGERPVPMKFVAKELNVDIGKFRKIFSKMMKLRIFSKFQICRGRTGGIALK
jgi:uncharacterized protein